MIKNYYSLFFILVFIAAFTKVNAQDAPVVTFNVPYQNNLKFNRFLYNPAFSFVREDNTYVSLYHRNQWVQFDDSPKVYMLSYTGRFSKTSGLGFGIYQQNVGVVTSFGGVANYSYNIKLKERMNLTLGFNVAYYNSGVNKTRTVTGEPDPIIMELRNNSLVSIKPGINFNYKDFDIGVYAENVVDYDFKSDEMSEKYTDKVYSGHVMYTHKMVAMRDLFKDSEFSLALRGRMSELYGFTLNGSLLVHFPRLGWLQTSLDDYYGVGIGAGFHLTKRLSLGYVYERTVKEGLVNLGPSHEIIMSFKLKDKLSLREQNKKQGEKKQASLEEQLEELEDEMLSEEEEGLYETDVERDADIEKLRMELDDESQYLLDALIKEDSIAQIHKAEFDKKVKNLLDYAKREQAARLERAKTEMLLMKRDDPGEDAEENPQTLEDLKRAKSGYYVVSTPPDARTEDEVIIERYERFTEAANALERKKSEGIEKNPYLIHVQDSSEDEVENIKRRERNNEVTDGSNAGRRNTRGNSRQTRQPATASNSRSANNNSRSNNNLSGNGGGIKLPSVGVTAGVTTGGRGNNANNRSNNTDTAQQPANNGNERYSDNGNVNEGGYADNGNQNQTNNQGEDNTNATPNNTNNNNASAAQAATQQPQANSATNNNNGQTATAQKTNTNATGNKPTANNNSQNKNTHLTNTKNNANGQGSQQTAQAKNASKAPSSKYVRREEDLSTEEEIKDYYAAKTDLVRQAPKRSDILTVQDVEPGYYVIANVFSEQENTNKFINRLKDRGIQAEYFINPQNNFRYVYLKKHDSWRDALISYYSNVNNTYFDTVWLMSINVD